MKEKTYIMQNILSTVYGILTWFAIYYLLCFVFTLFLESDVFRKLVNYAAQHISMRNSYKLTYFISYITATAVSAIVISVTAKCKKIVWPGVITFFAVYVFLVCDFLIVCLMNNNSIPEYWLELSVFGVDFNFSSIVFNGGKIHILSSLFRILPLSLVYYYSVKKNLCNTEAENN